MERLVEDSQILEVIQRNQSENLTVRRMMGLLGFNSTSAVHERLNRLEEKGLIKRSRRTVIEVVWGEVVLEEERKKLEDLIELKADYSVILEQSQKLDKLIEAYYMKGGEEVGKGSF